MFEFSLTVRFGRVRQPEDEEIELSAHRELSDQDDIPEEDRIGFRSQT